MRTLDLELLGLQVRIDADDPRFVSQLATFYETAPEAGHESEPALHVRVNGTDPSHGLRGRVTTVPAGALDPELQDHDATPTALGSAVNNWVARTTRRHFAFHAGAVSRGGRAVLLPGVTFSGKSTLCAGLARRGYELLSDELAALDRASERVVPYPRALSIRRDVLALLGLSPPTTPDGDSDGARWVTAAALGGKRATRSAGVAVVVAPTHRQGAATRPERLTPGHAVLALMGAACFAPPLRAAGFETVTRLALRVPCHRLVYSDLDQALEWIDRCFGEAVP